MCVFVCVFTLSVNIDKMCGFLSSTLLWRNVYRYMQWLLRVEQCLMFAWEICDSFRNLLPVLRDAAMKYCMCCGS